MSTAPSAPSGYLQALRALGDNLLAGAQDRLDLFAVELQEEKFRLIQTFLWISAAVFAAMMAMTFASLLVVYLFWESARIGVLGGLALFYGGALVAIIMALQRFIARQPSPFAATRREFETDRACIRNES